VRGFYGWRVVWAAFVLAFFGWGLGFYGPPVYLHAVREARGFSLPVVSAAVTLHFLVGAVMVANLPALYRRFGLPAVTRFAAIALAAGVCGWALALTPWQLFAATLSSGIGWAAMSGAAVNAVVSPWFVRARPVALGTAYNGASFAGLILSPLWVVAIALLGFPQAAMTIGFVTVAVVWWLAGHYFARTPAGMALAPDGDAPDIPAARVTSPNARPLPGSHLWRDLRFVTLVTGAALALFA
jgi:MFS family permease